MKVCISCGNTSNNDIAKFCSKCSSKMVDYKACGNNIREDDYTKQQDNDEHKLTSQNIWDRETARIGFPGGKLSIVMGVIVIILVVIVINATSNQTSSNYREMNNYSVGISDSSQAQSSNTPTQTEDSSLSNDILTSHLPVESTLIQYDDGSYYEGEVRNGVAHGYGVKTYAPNDERNRVTYTGDFVNGLRHGYGVITWSGGEVYEGQWTDDQMHGQGLMKYAEDDVASRVTYEGEFTNGIIHGWGIMTWSSGTVYEGGWNNNSKFDGYGVYTNHDGTIYEGNFKDDQRHGYGKQTQPSIFGTRTFEGMWENDKFIG